MVTSFSVEHLKRAIYVGDSMIKSKLTMAAHSRKLGDRVAEEKYFNEACKLNTKVTSLQAQVRIIEIAIN